MKRFYHEEHEVQSRSAQRGIDVLTHFVYFVLYFFVAFVVEKNKPTVL